MNEADKIRMDRLEKQVEGLERENKALRKELFKYKLKNGEVEEEKQESTYDILEQIRAQQKEYENKKYQNKIFEEIRNIAGIK